MGLLQAIASVDHQQAEALEGRPRGEPGSAFPSPSSSGSSMDGEFDGVIFTDAAGVPLTGPGRAAGGSLRPAAVAMAGAAGRRTPHRAAADWQPRGWLGSGRWGAFSRSSGSSSRGVAAHAFVDVDRYGAGASSTDSLDAEEVQQQQQQQQQQPSSSNGSAHGHSNGHANGNGAAHRVANGARNGAVPLRHGERAASSGSSGGPSSSSAGLAGQQGELQLAAKPVPGVAPPRPAPVAAAPPEAAAADPAAAEAAAAQASTSGRDGTLLVRAPRAVQGILRLVAGAGDPPADTTWQLVPLPRNPYRLANAVGEPLAATAERGSSGERVQALRLPEQGPCIIGGAFDRCAAACHHCLLPLPAAAAAPAVVWPCALRALRPFCPAAAVSCLPPGLALPHLAPPPRPAATATACWTCPPSPGGTRAWR